MATEYSPLYYQQIFANSFSQLNSGMFEPAPVTVSGVYTALATDVMILVSGAGNSPQPYVTLPNASGLQAGRSYIIKDIGSTVAITGCIVVSGIGGPGSSNLNCPRFDNFLTGLISGAYGVKKYTYDGSNWWSTI